MCLLSSWLKGSLLTLLVAAPSFPDVIYSVSIDDPNNLFAGYENVLTSTLIQAGNDWSKYLPGVAGTTTINVELLANTSIAREGGGSTTAGFVNYLPDGTRIYEQAVSQLYRTGASSSSSMPDAIISINPDYLKNELSFAPATPSDRTDALSVFRHELGHAIAFNGFLDPVSGAAPFDSSGRYESAYDQFITFADDGTPQFTGAHAEQVYGNLFNGGIAAPVPLTALAGPEALYHFGNADLTSVTCPTTDLLSDLMNGVVFCRGQQYGVSDLDLAILSDTGLSVDLSGNANAMAPEPSSFDLLIEALGAFALGTRYAWSVIDEQRHSRYHQAPGKTESDH